MFPIFLIPQVLQSVKFSTWFSKESLAGSDVYPVYSKDVRTFECFPRTVWVSEDQTCVNETPALHPCLTSPQSLCPVLPSSVFLHWTQIVQALDSFPHQQIPNVTSQKHLRGPSALPSGLSPPPCPRSLWAIHVLNFRLHILATPPWLSFWKYTPGPR